MIATLLLIDGEHHPPVIDAHIERLRAAGHDPIAALFLGGFEKVGSIPELDIPVLEGDPPEVIAHAVSALGIERVHDLSDEPIVDPRRRFALAGHALAAGAMYSGGGIEMTPPPRPRLTDRPTVAVIGTGKRTGKTGLSIGLARYWRAEGRNPCIVTMGRGGPATPMVLRAGEMRAPEAVLDALTAEGLHATSDYVEDALFAEVSTVGTRRVGAGPAGVTVHDHFAAGVQEALALDPDILLYEGSGTAIPPAHADSTVLVASASIDPEYLTGYLGPFRLALADAVVLVGPDASALRDVVCRAAPELPIFSATFRPEPTISISGRSVILVCTADPSAGSQLTEAILDRGATRVQVIHSLGDRSALSAELAAVGREDVVLTEVKGAAASVVVPYVREIGADLGFVHNDVVVTGGIAGLADELEVRWPFVGDKLRQSTT